MNFAVKIAILLAAAFTACVAIVVAVRMTAKRRADRLEKSYSGDDAIWDEDWDENEWYPTAEYEEKLGTDEDATIG